MWLTKLKIAIVEKDIAKLDSLIHEIPKLETKAEMEEALCLTKEASKLATILKNEASDSIKKIQNNLNYLKSTQNKSKPQFDRRL